MVYDRNRSIVGSSFTTQSRTGGNCDVGAGSGRGGTGGAGYRDGDTGRASSGSSSKSVPESSDKIAANSGVADRSGTAFPNTVASSAGGAARLDEYVDGSRRLQLPPDPREPDPLSPVTVHKWDHPEVESAASGGGHVVSFDDTRSPHHRCKRSAESPSCPEPEKPGHTDPWPTPARRTPVII